MLNRPAAGASKAWKFKLSDEVGHTADEDF